MTKPENIYVADNGLSGAGQNLPPLWAPAHGAKLPNRNFSYGKRPHHSRSTH